MRMNRGLVSVVIGAILGTTGIAHAAPVVDKSAFKNTQVSTFAFLSADITCADQSAGTASAQVFLSGGTFASPFGSGTGTSIDVFGFSNSCTGQSFGDATGSISGGVTGPNHPLTSARLTGSTNVFIDSNGSMPVPFSLDLTFTGNGDLSVSRDTTVTHTVEAPGGPFTITIQRGAFRNRTADVAGTITIAGVVFPVDIEFGATLLDNNSTTITVTK